MSKKNPFRGKDKKSKTGTPARGGEKRRRRLPSAIATVTAAVRVLTDEAGTAARSARRTRGLRRHGRLETLPPDARALCDLAYEGLQPELLADYHVHVAGVGTSPTGAFVHPRAHSMRDPRRFVRFAVFRRAYGITDDARADEQFLSRLLDCAKWYPSPPRHGLLAFDRFHRPDGSPDLANTELYVPNGYVFRLAADNPRLFAPVISVHPQRPDALEALEHWHAAGGRIVKWLPNVMGINPASPSCDPFYEMMRKLGLSLLSHGGTEHALETDDSLQYLGNPQRLERALSHGVKVIVAHCASLGRMPDLKQRTKKPVPCFDLFMNMMDDPQWEGLLFGEISGLVQANRGERPLRTIMERTDLHERLVNGSDYPIPALRLTIIPRRLARQGFIDTKQRRGLEAIRAVNPLLFDLVLKRTVRHPETGAQLPARIFYEHPDLPLATKSIGESIVENAG